jgi:hypothetical protein
MTAKHTADGSIRQIAVPLTGADFFATAEFEAKVTLWSFAKRAKLTELNTALDFGGNRLALVGNREMLLLTARFSGPLEAYNPGGKLLWSRTNLFGIQQLTELWRKEQLAIGVGCEHGPYLILDPLNGATLASMRGATKIFANPYAPVMLYVNDDRSICLGTIDAKRLWQHSLQSFTVLHAAFSPTEVAYSEATGPLRCVQIDGNKKWEIAPTQDRHFVRTAWNCGTGRWMAIDWNYESGGSKRLFEITEDGMASVIADLGEPAGVEFFGGGDYLVTSSGEIVATGSGEVIWRFEKGHGITT